MTIQAATIIESSGKSVELKEEPGLYSVLFEHEIKATKGPFNWAGPKITQAQWNELLAFFKWTYDTEKSEAQARLFVHPTLGWKIWAFPQKGGTGMTTKEIENEDFALQRAAIPEGYIAWGTVHHHCSSHAFQSSTDNHDEKSVDGLHITIGNMDEPMFDIHCRIYINKHKYEPNMSAFWDVGDEARDKMSWLAELKYNVEEVINREARLQMCIPPDAANSTFPELWKTNYILPQRVQAATTNSLLPGQWCYHCQKHTNEHTVANCPSRAKQKKGRRKKNQGTSLYSPGNTGENFWDAKVVDEMWIAGKNANLTEREIVDIVTFLGGTDASEFLQNLVDLASDNYRNLSDMHTLMLQYGSKPSESAEKEIAAMLQEEAEEKEEAKLAAAEAAQEQTVHARTREEMIQIWHGGGMD